jgi:hypothetical protein
MGYDIFQNLNVGYFNSRVRVPGIHCTGVGWAPEQVWTLWRSENSQMLPGIKT